MALVGLEHPRIPVDEQVRGGQKKILIPYQTCSICGLFLLVDGARVHHHLRARHHRGAAGGRGGEERLPDHRGHHPPHRQLCHHLLHHRVHPQAAHLPGQEEVCQGHNEHGRLQAKSLTLPDHDARLQIDLLAICPFYINLLLEGLEDFQIIGKVRVGKSSNTSCPTIYCEDTSFMLVIEVLIGTWEPKSMTFLQHSYDLQLNQNNCYKDSCCHGHCHCHQQLF